MRHFGKALFFFALAAIASGCGNEEQPGAGKALAEKDGKTQVPEATGAGDKTDLFVESVPGLRAKVREASLRSFVQVPDDIPFYDLSVEFDTDFMSYTGSVDLWVKNRSARAWDKLVFHLYPNAKWDKQP